MRQFTQGSLPFLLFCFTINFILIYRGIEVSNGSADGQCQHYSFAQFILVRVLTLGTPNPANPDASILNGLGFMWNPVGHNSRHTTLFIQVSFWEALARPQTWLAAAGQIFFSLSVGFGIIMTYASYTKPTDDIALSSVSAASCNGFFEVALGGMIVIPAAFIFLGPESIISAKKSELPLTRIFSSTRSL